MSVPGEVAVGVRDGNVGVAVCDETDVVGVAVCDALEGGVGVADATRGRVAVATRVLVGVSGGPAVGVGTTTELVPLQPNIKAANTSNQCRPPRRFTIPPTLRGLKATGTAWSP